MMFEMVEIYTESDVDSKILELFKSEMNKNGFKIDDYEFSQLYGDDNCQMLTYHDKNNEDISASIEMVFVNGEMTQFDFTVEED